jgi:hypothetical protein
MSCERKHRVLRELQHTIYVEDPCPYALDKRVANSVIDTKLNLRAFFEGSYADHMLIDNMYWKKVNYEYLPKKKYGSNIVWYEFLGKHIQIVN